MKIKKNCDYIDIDTGYIYEYNAQTGMWFVDVNGVAVNQKEMQRLLDGGALYLLEIDNTGWDTLDPVELFEAPEQPTEKVVLPADYNPNLTNSSIPLTELAKMLKVAVKKSTCPDNISILFHGVPGLGKTYAAKYLARKLNKELIIKPLAQLLDKWVGATERNIKAAFDKAEKTGAILLIDEVDSIAGTRDGPDKRDHQIQTVNGLLQTLDSFKGICIFTTNSLSRMDPAILRRCMLDIEMHNMTAAQATNMARKIFPGKRIGTLANNVYAPADFIKVRNQLLFVEEERITKAFIRQRLTKAAEQRTGVSQNKISVGFTR